ncbi:MAG: hypothetical protein H0W72_16930 [Planctomycetes bacterium]|nr:hypothetical protein [Planctomycetota bacterium]
MITEVFPCDRFIEVHVVEEKHGRRDRVGLHLARSNHNMQPGDTIWWQGGYAMWTPKSRRLTDVPLERRGPSFTLPRKSKA